MRDTPSGKGAPKSRYHPLVARTAVPDEAATKVRAELSALARELRERRQLLGQTQVQLSKSSKVSRTVINEIEAGTRFPSVRTYAKLRAALGLEPPAAASIPQRLPLQLEEDLVSALCAGLLARHEATLADLASALDIAIPAVRENLERVAERLRPVGYTLTDDGGTVRLWPLPGPPSEVVRCLSTVEETVQPSPEQGGILGIVAYFGQITRTQIEAFRGEGDMAVTAPRCSAAWSARGCSPRSAPIAASVPLTSTRLPPRRCGRENLRAARSATAEGPAGNHRRSALGANPATE